MPKFEKLIITCAIAGTDVVPSQSPYVPITPEDIAEECYRAEQAGAAIVHLHSKNPVTGEPTGALEVWGNILKAVKRRCPNLVIGVTTGGGMGMKVEERLQVIPTFKPEICSLTPESVTNSIHHIIPRIKEWKNAWEKPYLENSYRSVFANSLSDIVLFAQTMRENGTKPELEFFSTSGLYNARWLAREGIVDTPVHMQFVLGALGGTGAYPPEVLHMQTEALRMFGEDGFTWSVIGVGFPRQYTLGALAISMGGHVRVGLEDNIYRRRGVLCKSNAEMVQDIRVLAEMFDREVATSDEAREILHLKGAGKVNY
jgi:uncharacterized protein (DUF849 family)